MADFLTRLKAAMRKTGAVASGETPTTDEQTDGLAIANQLLDSWNAERPLMYDVKRTTHTLIASTNPHTIGTGGNFDTDRPVKIEDAGIIQSGETTESPIYVAKTMAEYAAILDKASTGTPDFLYYEPAFALGKIHLYPVPDAADTLVLYRWTPLASIASVNTTVSLPPGYEEAFDLNLAVRLALDGMGTASSFLIQQAKESLARIKPVNMEVPILRNDAPFGESRSSGRGNIYTGY